MIQPLHTILIIDDDFDDQELIRDALNLVAPEVNLLFAPNGMQAFKVLLSSSIPIPDYIFLDLNMPLMGGKECLKKIKADPVMSPIPIIIFSTHKTDIQETQKLKSLGAKICLQKPQTFNGLCDILTETLSHELGIKK